jgi:hypothetical protein
LIQVWHLAIQSLLVFHGKRRAPYSTCKLEFHPLSAVRDNLFKRFAATLRWSPPTSWECAMLWWHGTYVSSRWVRSYICTRSIKGIIPTHMCKDGSKLFRMWHSSGIPWPSGYVSNRKRPEHSHSRISEEETALCNSISTRESVRTDTTVCRSAAVCHWFHDTLCRGRSTSAPPTPSGTCEACCLNTSRSSGSWKLITRD